MSDPMTNVDIEDVLASIRRLVSEDTRPRGVSSPAATAPRPVPQPLHPAPSAGDRLVLTPSLRVMEPETPEVATPRRAVDPEQPWNDPEARLADLWQDDAPQPASDTTQVASAPDSAVAGITERVMQTLTDQAAPEHVSEPIDADFTDVSSENRTDSGDSRAEVAEWSPAPQHSDDAGPQDAASGDAPLSDAMAWKDYVGDDHIDDIRPDTQRDGADPAAGDAPASDDSDDRIAAHQAEQVDEPGDETWTDMPDPRDGMNAGMDAGADDPRYRDDLTAEDDPSDDFADDGEGDGANDGMDAAGNILAEESVIDEAMLRELVADIVRQELMGALGERITRNVRKLVRREIHRAMSAQDFE